MFKSFETALKIRELRVVALANFLELTILFAGFILQRLDGGECNPFLVHSGDMLVVLAEAERCAEILCHRTEMTNAGALLDIAPLANPQRRALREALCVVYA